MCLAEGLLKSEDVSWSPTWTDSFNDLNDNISSASVILETMHASANVYITPNTSLFITESSSWESDTNEVEVIS